MGNCLSGQTVGFQNLLQGRFFHKGNCLHSGADKTVDIVKTNLICKEQGIV